MPMTGSPCLTRKTESADKREVAERKWLGLIVLMALVLVLSGCSGNAEYRDVSNDARYIASVGQRCTVLRGLRAHGYTLNLNHRDVIDAVDVTTLPGVGGIEIIFTVAIPKGTKILVTGAQECTNCPFGRVRYAVNIPDLPRLAPYRVFVRPEVLAPDETDCVKS
jgi:hypothetical protein